MACLDTEVEKGGEKNHGTGKSTELASLSLPFHQLPKRQ